MLYAVKKVLEYFRGNIPLSKLNSIDKVSETTENGAVSLIKTYYQKWRILNGLRILPSINEGTGEGWKQYRGTGSGSKRSRCRRNIRRCIYRDKKAQTTVRQVAKSDTER